MVHPSSPIIDFYPIDFANDLNGKKFQWQAIALLPFIDAERLRLSLAPLDSTLTPEEAKRNTLGLLFTSTRTPLGRLCAANVSGPDSPPLVLNPASPHSPSFGGTVRFGKVAVSGSTLPVPPGGADWGLSPIPGCATSGGIYTPPPYAIHRPTLLIGCALPPMTLNHNDKPHFSRDSEQATRSMLAKFQTTEATAAEGARSGRATHTHTHTAGAVAGWRRGGGGERASPAQPAKKLKKERSLS